MVSVLVCRTTVYCSAITTTSQLFGQNRDCDKQHRLVFNINNLGIFFFLSQSELELVLSHGIPLEDIIYSGVCKQLSQIKYAAKNGFDLLVFDNEAELRKISRCHPNAK